MLTDTSTALICVIGYIFGLQFGSFVTLVSHRLPKNEDIVVTPSHCTSCDHRLTLYDLFPVISWLFSRGSCRYCKHPISIRYPIIELGAGAIAAALCFTETPFSMAFFFKAVLLLFSYCAVIMALEKRKPPLWFYAPYAVFSGISAFILWAPLLLGVTMYYIALIFLCSRKYIYSSAGSAYACPLLAIYIYHYSSSLGLLLVVTAGYIAIKKNVVSFFTIEACIYIALCIFTLIPSSII